MKHRYGQIPIAPWRVLDEENEDSVRGFEVLVEHKKNKTFIRYPAETNKLYSGEDAYKFMDNIKDRDLMVIAQTETFGKVEQLDIKEMKEIYEKA